MKITARDKIIRGIAAYKPMQEEIKQAIRDHGGKLTEDEFDEAFSDSYMVEENGKMVRKLRPLTGGSKITGSTFLLFSAYPCRQQEYLQLAQFMLRADLLDATTEDETVIYRNVEEK